MLPQTRYQTEPCAVNLENSLGFITKTRVK
jgi:hypothetical protein